MAKRRKQRKTATTPALQYVLAIIVILVIAGMFYVRDEQLRVMVFSAITNAAPLIVLYGFWHRGKP
jgi:uncharacterized membrane protein (DUF373 family)